jgi:hypothetical protein
MTKSTPTPETKAPARKVGTNSNKLPFTQDRSGARQELRRGGVRAIGRIMGDEARLADLLTDLEVLAEYATARYAEQINERLLKQKAARARVAAEQAALRANAEQEVKRREAAAKVAKQELSALKASLQD